MKGGKNKKMPSKIAEDIAKLEAEKQRIMGIRQGQGEYAMQVAKRNQLKKQIWEAKWRPYIESGKRTWKGVKLGFHNVGVIGKSVGATFEKTMSKIQPAQKPMSKSQIPRKPMPAVGSDEWLRQIGAI